MKKGDFAATLKYAGAFIVWVIGSGFSTGQEILQFFGSYGFKSVWVLLINLLGFVGIGTILVVKGFDTKDREIDCYEYYCGKRIGKIYSIGVPLLIIIMTSVLFSAFGATLEQYYSVNRYLGSFIVAVLVLAVYLIDFERMVRLVSKIGIFVIIFIVFVGLYSVISDFDSIGSAFENAKPLAEFQTSNSCFLSAVLYLSMNFLSGSIFYNQLGRSATSRKSAKWGSIIGALVLMLTITCMTFAVMMNGEAVSKLEVPALYLAQNIHPFFGGVFSVILLLGMFSSTVTMVWSFCSRFFIGNKKKNTVFSIITVLLCLIGGLLPFGKLVAVIYPLVGWFGLFFIIAVLLKPIVLKIKK